MKDSNMIIQDGKFYKNGIVVPVEFGNKEQIECLRLATAYAEKIGEGLVLDVDFEEIITFEASAYFKCVCGKNISFSVSDCEDENIDQLAGLKRECRCGKKYITGIKDRELIVKLNPKAK